MPVMLCRMILMDLTNCYQELIDQNGTVLIQDGKSTGNAGVSGYYTVIFNIKENAPMNWKPVGTNITFTSVSTLRKKKD